MPITIDRRSRRWLAAVLAVALSCGWTTFAQDASAQTHKPPAAHGKKPHAKPETKPPKRQPAPPAAAGAPIARTRPAPAGLASPSSTPMELRAEIVTLDNDLRVVLSPDRGLPSLSIAMAYAAGSGREAVGQQGIARLAAAAMTAGPSRNLGPGEHLRLVRAQGGSSSSFVDREVALFVDVLPANALELGLWLEASRMNGAEVNDTTLATATDLAPSPAGSMADARTRVEEMAFQGFWPYEHPDRVLFADRAKAASAARDFQRAWYTPANAVLAIAGNFDPDEAIRLVHDLFDGARGNQPPGSDAGAALPDQTNQRSTRIDVGPSDRQGLVEGWAAPAAEEQDHDALTLAAVILRDRMSLGQRIHADRVRRLSPATTVDLALEARREVDLALEARRGHALWTVALTVPPGVDLEAERAVVDGAIDELGRLGPTPEELRAAWTDAELDFFQRMDSLDERAAALARAEISRGDVRRLREVPAALLRVTRDDVRKAVSRTLTPTRRNVVEIRGPKPPEPPPRTAAPPAVGPRPAAGAGHKHTTKPPKKKSAAPPPAKKKKDSKPTQHGGKRP